MSLVLKRHPVWIEFLPQSDSSPESTVLLLGDDGCQVLVHGALLLAASPLVRSICAGHGIPPALSPIVLSLPAVPGDVLQAVGEMLKTGLSAALSYENMEKTEEVFKLLGVEAVLTCDNFRDGTNGEKDQQVKKMSQINKGKNECVIEIEVEIGKREEGRDLIVDTNLSGQGGPSELKKHTAKHVFKCAKCEYKTKTIDKLEKHRKVHERIKKCDECEFRTTRGRTLVAHKRTHIGDRPFECDQCDYKAKTNYHIISHKLIHTDERHFECDLCDYKSRGKSALVLHKRIHTGERPFKCDRCKYSGRNWNALDSHKKVHTGEKPFVCDVCEFKTSQLNNLTRHKLIHSGEKPFECNQCEFKCRTKSTLKAHFKSKHTSASEIRLQH